MFDWSRKKNTVGLLGVIADEDTCVGFALAGVGEQKKGFEPNIHVVSDDTTPEQIEAWLRDFIQRKDILVVIICKKAANMVRSLIDNFEDVVPQIIEISSIYDRDYVIETASFTKRVPNLNLNEIEQISRGGSICSLDSIDEYGAGYVVSATDEMSYPFGERRGSPTYLSKEGLQRIQEARTSRSGMFGQHVVDDYLSSMRDRDRDSLVSRRSSRSSITSRSSATSMKSGQVKHSKQKRTTKGRHLTFADIMGSQFKNEMTVAKEEDKDVKQNKKKPEKKDEKDKRK